MIGTTFILLLLLAGSASASSDGDAGVITGTVTDDAGNPLIGAAVHVYGTYMGAMTDASGEYTILLWETAFFSVACSYIGLHSQITEIEEVLQGDSVHVDFILHAAQFRSRCYRIPRHLLDWAYLEGFRPEFVPGGKSGGSSNTDVLDLVGQAPGVADCGLRYGEEGYDSEWAGWGSVHDAASFEGELHVRGGRAGETAFLLDGIDCRDPQTGAAACMLPLSALRDWDSRILSRIWFGGFDAGYGNSQSGIVDVVSREGSNGGYHGSLDLGGNDWEALGLAEDWTWGRGSASGDAVLEGEACISGPEPLTSLLLPALGIRIPGQASIFASGSLHRTGGGEENRYGYGFDDWSSSASGNAKLVYVPAAGTRISATGTHLSRTAGWFGIGDFWSWSRYEEPWIVTDSLSPYFGDTLAWGRDIRYGLPSRSWKTTALGAHLTQTLSDAAFLDAGLSLFSTSFDARIRNDPEGPWGGGWLGEGWTGSQWQSYDPGRVVDGNGFYRAGSFRHAWSESESTVLTFRSSLTVLTGNGHQDQILAGVELKDYDLFHYDVDVLSQGDVQLNRFAASPWSGSVFLQDRIRQFRAVTVNLGLRLDWFDPSAEDIEWGPSWPGCADAGIKSVLSPRIGFSYRLSDRDDIDLSYGHYSQMPRLEMLYGSGERISPSAEIPVAGNPDLSWETSRTFEAGYSHLFGSWNTRLHVAGYYREMSGLADTRQVSIAPDSLIDLFTWENLDLATATGLEVALTRLRDSGLSGSISYAWSIAEGTSSSSLLGYRTVIEELQPSMDEHPLDWDQRHAIRVVMNYRVSQGEGLRIAGCPVLEGFGAHLSWRYGSGFPYTASGQGGQLILNGERYPSTMLADLRLSRKFWIGAVTLEPWCEVDNLFQTRDIDFIGDVEWYEAETDTDWGTPDPTGYQQNMYAWSRPRTIRFGLGMEW